ncbi:MAG: AMP-binding protein [Candidatus Acidiferrales bacterium]
MATASRQLDRAAVQEQVAEIVRQLLAELGSHRSLQAVRGAAHLDRDLGLGSLERVELMLRLGAAFGSRLPDRVVAEADTMDDLVDALLLHARDAGVAPLEPFSAPRPIGATHSSVRLDTRSIESAETLQDVLRHRARADASRPHLYLREGEGRTSAITFGELYERAEACARGLGRHGVAPGDTVAIMLPTSQEFFFTFAGVLLAGAIPVPIYPPFRADRIAEYAERQSAILRNAEARLLVTFRQAERVARLLTPRIPSLAGVVNASRLTEVTPAEPAAPLPRANAQEIALLQYTSGSTGEPKGVILTHSNLLANIRAIGEAIEVRPNDTTVSWLPLYHDMGLIGAWMFPLYFGLPLAVLSPLAFLNRPERWLWAVHHHRATLGAGPNFAYELCVRKIADRDIEGLDLSSWRLALNGAEPVNPETLERFAERFARYGLRREALLPVYGLAEASLAVTMPPLGREPRVDRIERATFEREGRAVPAALGARPDDPNVAAFVSVGRPVPRHEVRIVDSSGCDAGERVEGALWFRGPSATRGYYRNSEATRALFPEGEPPGGPQVAAGDRWVDSGDRGYQADGEIYVTGRVKDIIIKAGRNLYPHEIEELAGRVAGVRKGCVVAFGITDDAAGTERLVVVAEVREKDRERIARAITDEVTSALGLPPDVVELLPPQSIPKTSSGKLRREETRRLYLAGKLAAPAAPTWLQVAKLAAISGAQVARRQVRRALELAYGVYAAVVFVAWIVPTWLLVVLASGRRQAARITSPALRLYMALVGCRIHVEGREHLDRGNSLVFVSNHASYTDVLFLMAALGIDYRFVAKIEVHSMPFIGTFLRKLGHVAFDRSDPQARLHQAEELEELLRRGESVFVFPEGTFTSQPGVRPFQLGAFKAAVAAGRPICPVALRGTRRFLRDGTYLPRPSSITLTVLPPLEPVRDAAPSDWHEMVRLRDAARAIIARHCGEPIL